MLGSPRRALLLTTTLAITACDLDVPDLNDPGLFDLLNDPTRVRVFAATTGLLIGARTQYASTNGYVSLLGILGRESYNLDPADPRFVSELLEGPLDPGNPVFGGSVWASNYANIWMGNVLLEVLDRADLSMEEREGIRGITKTVQVLDFLAVINTHDVNGAPIDINVPKANEPVDVNDLGPIRCKPAVFEHMISLLNEAQDHLRNAGKDFPSRPLFSLGDGFTGFDTPATFATFNRALLARLEVYRGNHPAALDALAGSFIARDAALLNRGVFHVFSGLSGDTTNDLGGSTIVAHPGVRARAETSTVTGKVVDARIARKLLTRSEPVTQYNLSSSDAFAMYQDIASPVPIIRNEELLLLRAEANMGLDTAESRAAAAEDINFIREASGGLPRLPVASAATEDQLLKQRRYSLLFEGGHRWIDMRRFGRLDELRIDDEPRGANDPPFVTVDRFPIPKPEVDARGGNLGACMP